MSTAPNGFQTPKTSWQASDVVTANDFNRIESNIEAIEQGQRTLDPAQVPSSNAGNLRQLLDWFANRIKAITGKTNWYDAPTKTIEQLINDLDSHLADNAKHIDTGIVTGTYIGDGQASRKIILGFTPKALFVFTGTGTTRNGNFYYGGLALNGHRIQMNSTTPVVEIVSNGFNVYEGDNVRANTDGSKYHYLAIR